MRAAVNSARRSSLVIPYPSRGWNPDLIQAALASDAMRALGYVFFDPHLKLNGVCQRSTNGVDHLHSCNRISRVARVPVMNLNISFSHPSPQSFIFVMSTRHVPFWRAKNTAAGI